MPVAAPARDERVVPVHGDVDAPAPALGARDVEPGAAAFELRLVLNLHLRAVGMDGLRHGHSELGTISV